MKKIVLSAVAAVVLTVGVYHLMRLMGANEPAAAAAEQEHIQFRWALPAYALEGVAIWGALAVGDPGWSAAIALAGVVALLVLWRFAPEPSKEEAAAEAAAAAQNEQRARITARIATLEEELRREREGLAALDSPPATSVVLERNDP